MLVLTRKRREGILISQGTIVISGENIIIRILDIVGDRVKIGIEAPSKYHIVREELITGTQDDTRE